MPSAFGDQAAGLRRLLGRRGAEPFAVFGARDGVAARALAHLACALAALDARVTVIDEHQGENAVAGAFGRATRRDLGQVLSGDARLEQVVISPLPGVRIVPAARAARAVAGGGASAARATAQVLGELAARADVVFVHAAAPQGRRFPPVAAWAHRRVVCIPADAAGMTAGYRLLGTLALWFATGGTQVLMTGGGCGAHAQAAHENLRALAAQRLSIDVGWLGWAGAAALNAGPGAAAGTRWQEIALALRVQAPSIRRRHPVPRPGTAELARIVRAASPYSRDAQPEI